MYSELLDQVFVPSMSNSEVFLINGDQEGVEFDILKRPQMPEFQSESRIIGAAAAAAAASHDSEFNRRESSEADHGDYDREQKKNNDCGDTQVGFEQPRDKRRLGLGEFSATSDHDGNGDEGFRTPTSLDHKIPEIKQCPPAPRKPMPFPSKKRKSSSSSPPNVRRSPASDLSQEVESLFPRPILDDWQRKIKKARTPGEEEDKGKNQ